MDTPQNTPLNLHNFRLILVLYTLLLVTGLCVNAYIAVGYLRQQDSKDEKEELGRISKL